MYAQRFLNKETEEHVDFSPTKKKKKKRRSAKSAKSQNQKLCTLYILFFYFNQRIRIISRANMKYHWSIMK